jgi:hypothetical protein
MIDKPVAQIGIEDLQRLVANKVSEPRSLEYKQALRDRYANPTARSGICGV